MKRILLVEKSATQAAATRMILEESGIDVDVVSTTAAALAQLENQPPDLVLASYALPDGTAAQLCSAIKSGQHDITSFAVTTSSGDIAHILECLAAGADGFIIKSNDSGDLPDRLRHITDRAVDPSAVVERTIELNGESYELAFDPDHLLDMLVATIEDLARLHDSYSAVCRQLEKLTPRSAEREVTRREIPDKPGTGSLRILLAEDSLTSQMLASSLLEAAGHQVTVVSNGTEAVEATGSSHFDLILMDVEMPQMGGLEATQMIRAMENNSSRHIPILAMTAKEGEEDFRLCRDAGMNACLSKPLKMATLQQTLTDCVTRLCDNVMPSDSPDSRQAVVAAVVDWEAALTSMLGDQELLQAVANAALQECPARLADVQTALAGGDAALLHRSAHTIKGLLQTFAAQQAVDIAAKVEDLAGKNKLPEIGTLMEEFVELVQRAMSDIQAHLNGE